MSAQTHENLDRALRVHLADEWGEKAVLITHWTIAAAGLDSDNDPRLMGEHSDANMPRWQVRGLLGDALFELDQPDDDA